MLTALYLVTLVVAHTRAECVQLDARGDDHGLFERLADETAAADDATDNSRTRNGGTIAVCNETLGISELVGCVAGCGHREQLVSKLTHAKHAAASADFLTVGSMSLWISGCAGHCTQTQPSSFRHGAMQCPNNATGRAYGPQQHMFMVW